MRRTHSHCVSLSAIIVTFNGLRGDNLKRKAVDESVTETMESKRAKVEQEVGSEAYV